jgi:adenylate cyclase
MKRAAPILAGAATLAAFLMAELSLPYSWRETLRENSFDLVLRAHQFVAPGRKGASNRIVVVDIDRRSLQAVGPWPWPRETVAQLVDAVAAAKPSVTAIDILFGDADGRSPAALARRLGTLTGRADVSALSQQLPDGDKLLAEALQKSPSVLGFVLDPENATPVHEGPQLFTRGTPSLADIWRARGVAGPPPLLEHAAGGLGALSLPAHADGAVRYVPMLVAPGDAILPGFALEAARVSLGGAGYILRSGPQTLTIGDIAVPLPADAFLRLVPVPAGSDSVLSAIDVMNGRDAARLAGAIVLIGSSAPEVGGLRRATGDALTPSVQIQARAVSQILTGTNPQSLVSEHIAEPLALAAVGAIGIAAGVFLPPTFGLAAMAAAIIVAWGTSFALLVGAERLIDPVTPSSVALVVFFAASITSYAQTRRHAALVRRRFEQHLAPAVVRRMIDEPQLVKLGGERREITALFTDVEGFTSMTHRADPEALVAALDDYFEGAANIIIDHGGMVDKIVGDAVHALFNAPVDLDNHARRAVDAAIALRTFGAEYRRRSGPAALGFGRTRIGLETGLAIVGDVGIRAKLDYTAHGDAVNAAARLEAANKQLGSSICVGPVAASRCDPALFRPLGAITFAGREDSFEVFEPWPEGVTKAWRDSYCWAHGLAASDPKAAIELFEKLAAERPDDPVPPIRAKGLRAGA